jgi:starch synthase
MLNSGNAFRRDLTSNNMTPSTKILFVSAEVAPLVGVGGLADVASALPKALKALGYDVRLMLPAYGAIDRQTWQMKLHGRPFAINLGGEPQAACVFTGVVDDVPVYFVDHAPTFSNRPVIYAASDEDPARFVIFSALALAALSQLDWRPDIIHLNDWHTAIMGRWLDHLRRDLDAPPALLTIHNVDYQGIVYRPNLGWASSLLPSTYDQVVNLLYEGIAHVDTVTTVSPTYAEEIMTPTYGAGLQDLLRSRSDRLHGVLNGIDVETFNPGTDRYIPANYNTEDLSGKATCKQKLQAEAGLPVRSDVPVFGMVTRLVEQKGLDILAHALPHLLNNYELQLVILGTGEERYHHWLGSLAAQYSDKFHLWLTFDAAVAQHIYAGSDAFLMPSRFEPCGLGQMIAMRYGTVPVVHSTGGLVDTVDDVCTGAGTGIRFDRYHPEALIGAVERTVQIFTQKDVWQDMVKRGMQRDFGWSRSAQRYGELYAHTIERHRSILAASI